MRISGEKKNLIFYSTALSVFKTLLALYTVYLIYSSVAIYFIMLHFAFYGIAKPYQFFQLTSILFDLASIPVTITNKHLSFLVLLYLYILSSILQYYKIYDDKVEVAEKRWIFWIDFSILISLILTYYWCNELLVLSCTVVYKFLLSLVVIASWTIVSYITIYQHIMNKRRRLKVALLSMSFVLFPVLSEAYVCGENFVHYILDFQLFYLISLLSVWVLLILSHFTLFKENRYHSS